MFSIIIDFGITLAAVATYHNWKAVKAWVKDFVS